jgi:uncharacterized protein YkwD
VGGRISAVAVALVSALAFSAAAGARPDSSVVATYVAVQAGSAQRTPAWRGSWLPGLHRRLRRERRTVLGVSAPASVQSSEKPALSAVDRAVLDGLNAVRARHRLRPLSVSSGLTAAARHHSLEMVRRGFFAHESADGSSFVRRIRRFYRNFRSAAENIAFGCPDLSADAAMSLWMKSPPHRRNILDPRWREIGIAVVHVDSAAGPDYQGDPTTVVTTDFGRR